MRLAVLLLAACRAYPDDPEPVPDAAAASGTDGAPTRLPCTGSFGSALSAAFGRLDGTLVSVVAPGGARACNGDRDHVHLQVRMDGAVYDVAVNVTDTGSPVGIGFLEADLALPAAWSEGWHTEARLDYAELGLRSTAFTPTGEAALASGIESELADVNHISVFMTGYGPDGGHLVHRNAFEQDGAVVLRPLASAPRALCLRFATQSF